jgi:hypothetical protein
MQVFLEKDEPRTLAIPYRTPGEPGRRFWNLKKSPALAARVSELSGCRELSEFVTRVNATGSRFATLGCAHWTKPLHGEGGCAREAGLYVDLVFDRLEVAARRRSYLDLVERLRRTGCRAGGDDGGPGLTIIRAQLQRVAFRKLDRTAWLMSTWVFGGGPTMAVAIAGRRRGLAAVAALCARVSREIEAGRGTGGTPIPP